jgi:hypothetical protein
MLKLAVIGGGPSAACVVEAVARHIASVAQVDMTVFEPGPNLWRGQVFQRDGDEVLPTRRWWRCRRGPGTGSMVCGGCVSMV